jgi:hypothetical protein
MFVLPRSAGRGISWSEDRRSIFRLEAGSHEFQNNVAATGGSEDQLHGQLHDARIAG